MPGGYTELQHAVAVADSREYFDRLAAYSRRSRRGLVVRLDRRRAMRDALRPQRTDHFGGEAA
jgi:hypothetical protein